MKKSFGEILKNYRINNGLSQDDLAKKLGTSKQVISRYENNQRIPKVSVVAEYAEKLKMPIEVLLGEEPKNNSSAASLDDGIEKVISMYNSLSAENQSKFLELCNLYLTSFPPGDKKQ